MSNQQNPEETTLEWRDILKTAGAAMIGGWAAPDAPTPKAAAQETRPISAAARNTGSLGARLQGVQHFGVTVQNMDRAFVFYTEVLGGAEIMRDGDFQGERIHNTC